MSRFTTHSAIYSVETPNKREWIWLLTAPLIWEVRDAAGQYVEEIIVPEGFETDLGTIPFWFRWLFNPADPQCAKAYILHDYLLEVWGPDRQLEIAGVFYQALKALDVSLWSRLIQIFAVIIAIDRW